VGDDSQKSIDSTSIYAGTCKSKTKRTMVHAFYQRNTSTESNYTKSRTIDHFESEFIAIFITKSSKNARTDAKKSLFS
jgi:hypothetical protein